MSFTKITLSLLVLSLLTACQKNSSESAPVVKNSSASAPGQAESTPHKHAERELKQLHWTLEATDKFNGLPFTVEGEVTRVDSPWGSALSFDGDADRLLVDANPFAMVGLNTDTNRNSPAPGDAFTVEVLIKPNIAGPNAREPRFFHVEDAVNTQRRLTLELRLDEAGNWWMDSFIKSEHGSLVLIDENLKHPGNRWSHLAVTYADGVLTSFVNGKQELSGNVDFLPIAATAKTSIGGRMNQVNWFDGEISDIVVSNRAVAPNEFVLLRKLEAVAE